MSNSIKKEDITKALMKIGEDSPLVEYVFEAYTPYWGGGYSGNTFNCLDDKCERYEFLWQGAEEFKGRMRWLARVALASFIDDKYLEEKGYQYIEKEAFNGIIEDLFGSTDYKQKNKHLDSSNAIAASFILKNTLIEYEGKPKPYANYKKILEMISNNQILKEKENKIVVNLSYFEEKCYQKTRLKSKEEYEFYCLFTIPRFYLLSMKIRESLKEKRSLKDFKDRDYENIARELFEKQAARQNTVRFKVSIYSRPNSLLDKPEGEPWRCFLAYLALLVPTLVGLGKGVTRGFGRFKLIDYTLNLEKCASVQVSKDSDFRSLLDKFKAEADAENLISLSKSLLEYIRKDIIKTANQKNVYTNIASTPRLSYALTRYDIIKNPRHPCPYPLTRISNCRPGTGNRPIRNVIEALSSIGKSTLKSVWKVYNYIPIKRAAPHLNTWTLGLPRSQKNRGYLLQPKTQGRRLSNIFLFPTLKDGKYEILSIALGAACDVPLKSGLFHIGLGKPRKILKKECIDVDKDIENTLNMIEKIISIR